MEKHRAIPKGYMTVGEVAKKMDVTVRTLQHYDREGLLRPSAVSEGGRRLYTDKDIIKLHQIYLSSIWDSPWTILRTDFLPSTLRLKWPVSLQHRQTPSARKSKISPNL